MIKQAKIAMYWKIFVTINFGCPAISFRKEASEPLEDSLLKMVDKIGHGSIGSLQ